MAVDTVLKMQRSSSSPCFYPWCSRKKTSDARVGCICLCSLGGPLVPSMIDLISVIYYSLLLTHEWSFSACSILKARFHPRVRECSVNFLLVWVWGWAAGRPKYESTIKDNLPTNLA